MYKAAASSVHFRSMPLLPLLSVNFHATQSPLKGMDKATQRLLNPDPLSGYQKESGFQHPHICKSAY
jgi:hypothetical protein